MALEIDAPMIYRSPTDVRSLVKATDTALSGLNHLYRVVLVNARTGEVVKRFTTDSDRDAYLTRNHYA